MTPSAAPCIDTMLSPFAPSGSPSEFQAAHREQYPIPAVAGCLSCTPDKGVSRRRMSSPAAFWMIVSEMPANALGSAPPWACRSSCAYSLGGTQAGGPVRSPETVTGQTP